jgi:hypothetical protein
MEPGSRIGRIFLRQNGGTIAMPPPFAKQQVQPPVATGLSFTNLTSLNHGEVTPADMKVNRGLFVNAGGK